MNIADRQVCTWCKRSSKNYHVASTVHKSNMGKYISKEQAEEILLTLPTNSIMLRGHCYGQYYLSKLKANNIIEHIPILLLGSYYFCMGIRFPSLSEIVRFYSCGKDETSSLPGLDFLNASILEDMGDIERFITLYDLDLIEDHQLPLLSGDIISRIGKNENDIICARNERTYQMGSVHISLLWPVIEDDTKTVLPYFHHQLSSTAFADLQNGGRGSFLIKKGTDLGDFLVLLVNVGTSNIQQFLIKSEFPGFVLCGRRFPSLGHIVNRYCATPIFDGVTLTRGIISVRNPNLHSSFDNSTDICLLNYEFMSNSDVFWRVNKTDSWNKGCLSMWKRSCNSEILLEMKAAETFRFHSKDSVIYPVDDSEFGAKTCTFIRSGSIGMYINFRNVTDFLFCYYNFKSSRTSNDPDFVSFLNLSFNKLRSNKIKRNKFYSAHCSIDDVNICSSPITPPTGVGKGHTSVVFDQIFMIPYVPDSPAIKISINVHAEANSSGLNFLSFAHKARPNGEMNEDRNEMLDYHLQVHRVPVLESISYGPFNDWLLNCPLKLLFDISDMMSSQEKNFFCVCVISHFLFRRKMLYQMLRRLMIYSLETSSLDSILRQDSLTTTFLSQLLQILCRTEFIELIREQLSENCNDTFDDETHIALIIKALNDLVSQNDVLRNILVVICQTTQEIFADSLLLSRKIISVILVLRFACPLLLKATSLPANVVKLVQMLANKSLSSSESESGTVLTFRELFDGISKIKFKEECSELYTFPWHGSAALACFLLFTTISRKHELLECLSEEFKHLIYLHHYNC